MAFGASRAQVLAIVMRESLWVLIAGLAAGIPSPSSLHARSINALPDVSTGPAEFRAGHCGDDRGLWLCGLGPRAARGIH